MSDEQFKMAVKLYAELQRHAGSQHAANHVSIGDLQLALSRAGLALVPAEARVAELEADLANQKRIAELEAQLKDITMACNKTLAASLNQARELLQHACDCMDNDGPFAGCMSDIDTWLRAHPATQIIDMFEALKQALQKAEKEQGT